MHRESVFKVQWRREGPLRNFLRSARSRPHFAWWRGRSEERPCEKERRGQPPRSVTLKVAPVQASLYGAEGPRGKRGNDRSARDGKGRRGLERRRERDKLVYFIVHVGRTRRIASIKPHLAGCVRSPARTRARSVR